MQGVQTMSEEAMKQYPEGTRWALRLHSGEMALWFCHDEISRHERKARQTFATRAEALRRLGCLNCVWTDAAVLVRIPPPRPKRSVEQRIAEAVKTEREAVFDARKAELVRADKRIVQAVRERTEVILNGYTQPADRSGIPRGSSFADWLRDLRDGKDARIVAARAPECALCGKDLVNVTYDAAGNWKDGDCPNDRAHGVKPRDGKVTV